MARRESEASLEEDEHCLIKHVLHVRFLNGPGKGGEAIKKEMGYFPPCRGLRELSVYSFSTQTPIHPPFQAPRVYFCHMRALMWPERLSELGFKLL